MGELRDLLSDLGYGDVRTHLASGNAVFTSRRGAPRVQAECEKALAERFGFDIDVLVRTAQDLREIVVNDPLAEVADDPAKYAVAFLSEKPTKRAIEKLASDLGPERVSSRGLEVYVWCPAGLSDGGLMKALGSGGLAEVVTVRNWRTVTKLAEMAGEPDRALTGQ